jgi:L-asparaginase
MLIATGGTIAMQDSASGGATPALNASAIAGERNAVELVTRDLFAKPSASIALADVAQIAAAIDEAQAEGMDGVIIAHGTDTIAETAFALGLIGRWSIPVILTGAMRHNGVAGADGPANIAAAIAVASDPAARLGEPLLVFGDEIHLASLVHKAHGSRLHAFSSSPLGPIGSVKEGRAHILLRPARSLPELMAGGVIPPVPILLVGSDLEPESVEIFAAESIAGLVIAAAGGGHVSARSVEALTSLAAGKPVILTSRSEGGVLSHTYGYAGSEMELLAGGLLSGGRWRPEQARIMLQLLLSRQADRTAITAALAH